MSVEEIVDNGVAVNTEDSQDGLESFDYTKYIQFIPDSIRDQTVTMLSTKSYGWKYRAKILLAIEVNHNRVSNLQDELVESFEPRERKSRTPEDKAFSGMRAYLNAYTDEALNTLAQKYNVQANTRDEVLNAVTKAFLASI